MKPTTKRKKRIVSRLLQQQGWTERVQQDRFYRGERWDRRQIRAIMSRERPPLEINGIHTGS